MSTNKDENYDDDDDEDDSSDGEDDDSSDGDNEGSMATEAFKSGQKSVKCTELGCVCLLFLGDAEQCSGCTHGWAVHLEATQIDNEIDQSFLCAQCSEDSYDKCCCGKEFCQNHLKDHVCTGHADSFAPYKLLLIALCLFYC